MAWSEHMISVSFYWWWIHPPNYIWHRLILKFICVPSNSCCRGLGRQKRRAGHPETQIFAADNLYVDD